MRRFNLASAKNREELIAVNESLANVMKVARSIADMSVRAHAKKIGLTPSTLLRIEDGLGCDLATLVQIRRATGVKYAVLLKEER